MMAWTHLWTSAVILRTDSTDVRKIKRARRAVCKKLRQLAIIDGSLELYMVWRGHLKAASDKNIRRAARFNARAKNRK